MVLLWYSSFKVRILTQLSLKNLVLSKTWGEKFLLFNLSSLWCMSASRLASCEGAFEGEWLGWGRLLWKLLVFVWKINDGISLVLLNWSTLSCPLRSLVFLVDARSGVLVSFKAVRRNFCFVSWIINVARLRCIHGSLHAFLRSAFCVRSHKLK